MMSPYTLTSTTAAITTDASATSLSSSSFTITAMGTVELVDTHRPVGLARIQQRALVRRDSRRQVQLLNNQD